MIADSDMWLVKCERSGLWVHAQCDRMDELSLVLAATAATRPYLAPAYRDPRDHAVAIGELPDVPNRQSSWPVKPPFLASA